MAGDDHACRTGHCRVRDGRIVAQARRFQVNPGDVPAEARVQLRFVMRRTGKGDAANTAIADEIERTGRLLSAQSLPRFTQAQRAQIAKSFVAPGDDFTAHQLRAIALCLSVPLEFRHIAFSPEASIRTTRGRHIDALDEVATTERRDTPAQIGSDAVEGRIRGNWFRRR